MLESRMYDSQAAHGKSTRLHMFKGYKLHVFTSVKGEMNGPSAWDGYVVAVTADACVKTKHTGQIVPISIPERPAFYNKQYVLQ